MTNFAILRTAKIKKTDVGGMSHHHARTKDTPNANPEQKQDNELLAGKRPELVPELVAQRIANIEERNGRKTRKDAVAAIEVLMTASPEFFRNKDDKTIKAWAKQSVDWAKEHFGEENVVSAVLHMDESTPHIHAVVVPETKQHKLSAKEWLGGREKMQVMQDGYAKKMQGLDLKRGVRGSKATHMDIKKWYAEGLPKAKEQLKQITEQAISLKANVEKTLQSQFQDVAQFFQVRKIEKSKGQGQDLTIEKAKELLKAEEIRKEKELERLERLEQHLQERTEKRHEQKKDKDRGRGLSL